MGAIAVSSIVAQSRGEQVAPYTYVKPILVTRQNIDEERIQQMLKMDWRMQP
jgi:hypothetical protein